MGQRIQTFRLDAGQLDLFVSDCANCGEDAAVVHIGDVGARIGTVRALESRGLVARISYDTLALTDDGWPVASLAAQVSSRRADT